MNEALKEAWDVAVRLLSRREYARKEIADKLVQRGVSDADIAEVLDRLMSAGYQSDARFAEHFTRFRAGKGYGPKRIRMELQQKGVADSLIDEGFEQAHVDWYERVAEVFEKKFKGQVADSWEARSKQSRFLDYRGFTQDQIASCLQPDLD